MMMETQNYWEDSATHAMQVKYESLDGRSCKDEIYRMGIGAAYCEGNLNFATASEDDEVYAKKKVSRQDPMSHRIIEKRRRDRMNNCLADLSRLIPAEYLKKGRGRVEKTEIIEMAIRHMKHLQGLRQENNKHPSLTTPVHTHPEDSVDDSLSHSTSASTATEHYRLGFQECLSETMHFLIEVEGFFARDSLCVQLISHLQQHCEKILATSDRFGFPHPEIPLSNGSVSNGFSNNSGIPTMCATANGNNSDRGSSSGVSSFGELDRARTNVIPPSAIVSSDDSNHSTHSQSTASVNSSRPPNYKFKSSIKQRFSAERIRSSPILIAPPPSTPTTTTIASSTSTTPVHADKPHGVPIFALHDAGSFYIPLTVEASLLRPHMTFVPETGPDMVLHPVTISVNFNHTSSIVPTWAQASASSPTHHH